MDHRYVEEHQLIERYVLGGLPEDELASFEEHYLACPECLDQLQLAESMARGFKRAAGQDVARLAASRQLAVLAWLSRLGRSRQAAVLAMALLVAVLVPGGLAWRELGQRGRELEETRQALEGERQRAAASARQAAEAERLGAELDASRSELSREQEAHARAAEQLAAARRPQANVPILFLGVERGGGDPSHRLRLPPAGGWIVLALEIDPPLRASYRAVLRDGTGREVWRGDGLHPNQLETLSLSLPATLLSPGVYALVVDDRRFPFRVLPAD